jgi:hypothetical protein
MAARGNKPSLSKSGSGVYDLANRDIGFDLGKMNRGAFTAEARVE